MGWVDGHAGQGNGDAWEADDPSFAKNGELEGDLAIKETSFENFLCLGKNDSSEGEIRQERERIITKEKPLRRKRSRSLGTSIYTVRNTRGGDPEQVLLS